MSQRASERPMKTGGRSSSLVERMPPPLGRALAVVALAGLAGLAAFVVTSNDPKTYERESSFVIRPSETVPPELLPDVVGTLVLPVGGATQTIVDVLSSARLRESTAIAAGLPPDSVAESGAEYSWTASRQPSSAIVNLKLTGPSDAKILAMQSAVPREAASLVAGSFGMYRLESLDAATSPKQIGPKTAQTVALAVILGAFIGIGLVLAEGRLRSSLRTWTVNPGRDGRPTGTDGLSGQTDWLESTFRESPETGAFVRRAGPSRNEVAYPEEPPKPETAGPKPETERPKRQTARRKR